jgi:site-specific recombinase XerD
VIRPSDHVAEFIAQLVHEGYRPESIQTRRATATRLVRWLERRQRQLVTVDEDTLREFLRCQKARGGMKRGVPRTLAKFLAYLRDHGLASPRVLPAPHPHDSVLADFAQYLQAKRGLKASTVVGYSRRVRRFLSHVFGSRRPILRRLRARTILDFFRENPTAMTGSSACEVRASVRAFVGYAQMTGQLTTDLRPAIPKVRRPADRAAPKYMDEARVDALLLSSKRDTPTGLRNHAILLLLARTGLRPCEVRRLQLTDVDWTRSALLVHGKRGRADWVPFSREIGAALAAYIQRGRPRCTSSALFLCLKAPYRDFGSSRTISSLVLHELQRAGIAAPRTGGYLLRHSFAARLLRGGASLTELGSALRHGHPLSTKTYVHVQTDQLRLLAQPWPGSVSK